ncbi:MAG: hypothetical protein AAB901_02120 [Patescibacteria group bacterium]|mgnify:CR=1 FL=1
MNSKILVGIAVVCALGLASYLWYSGQPKKDAVIENATSTPSTAKPQKGASVNPAALKADVTGTWQSTDDPKFTREFRANGTVVDRYEGNKDATTEGSWKVVTDSRTLPASIPNAKDLTIIQVGFPEEVLLFTVVGVSSTELELSYVGRGNTLHFTRIK